MNTGVAMAARAGTPQPHPWFVSFCATMLAEEEGRAEAPEDPTVN